MKLVMTLPERSTRPAVLCLRAVISLQLLQALAHLATPAPAPWVPYPTRQRAAAVHAPTLYPTAARPGAPAAPAAAADPAGPRQTTPTGRGRRGGSRRRGRRGGTDWRRQGEMTDHDLFIGQLNIQSLRGHLPELRNDIGQVYAFDVLCLNETWLSTEIPDRLLNIDGYKLLRRDRPTALKLPKGKGGVAVYIRDTLQCELLPTPHTGVQGSNLETIWTAVKVSSSVKYIVCSAYRVPNNTSQQLSNDLSDFEAQLQAMLTEYAAHRFVITGDFNHCLRKEHREGRPVLSRLFDAYGFSIVNITRPTYRPACSVLDVIATNCPDRVIRSGVTRCHLGGPHDFTRIALRGRDRQRQQVACRVQKRCLSRVDVDDFKLQIASVDWSPMFTCTSTAEKWQFFRQGFLQELDRVAPLRNIPVKRPFVVPLTCQTRQIIRQRQAALNSGFRHEYQTLNRLCKAAIRRESREFFQRELDKKGRGRFWQILKPVIGKKQTTSLLSNVTPDALNDYYVSVGPNTAASIPAPTAPVPTRLPRVTTSSFAVQPIDIHTLHGTLLNMKPSATPGSCGFSMDMFTKFYSAIGFLLLDVINSSLVTGNVPTEWKRALITPIPKSKKTSGPADTRPITILPPPMKVVEKVVQNQLVEYLEANHLLSDSQHGYRRNHSTESALHVITDRVYRAMDCGEIGILVLLDLSKMFDVIPHETLLRKLHLYGVETRWFRNYITGHTQQVQMKTANGAVLKSSPKNNGMGIFQGGSLSCALCLLFTNDISLYVDDDVTVTQYADDTSVLITGKKSDLQHLVHRMEAILSSLFQWFCANGMKSQHCEDPNGRIWHTRYASKFSSSLPQVR